MSTRAGGPMLGSACSVATRRLDAMTWSRTTLVQLALLGVYRVRIVRRVCSNKNVRADYEVLRDSSVVSNLAQAVEQEFPPNMYKQRVHNVTHTYACTTEVHGQRPAELLHGCSAKIVAITLLCRTLRLSMHRGCTNMAHTSAPVATKQQV